MTATTQKHHSKFIGFGLVDALRDAGLVPESEKYLAQVVLTAEAGKSCKLILRYQHTPKNGSALFSDESFDIAWQPLFDALKESGLFPIEDHQCRRIRIEAPVDKPCTITFETFADTRLVSLVRDGHLRVAQEREESRVR